MERTTLTKVAMQIVACAACAASLLLFPFKGEPELQAAPPAPVRYTRFLTRLLHADAGFPVRLRIPGIGVDSLIEQVGLSPKGVMEVPRNPDNVGWYNLGSRPGTQGSAVFGGHLDWYNGKTGVFQNLERLQKGDVLSVETDKGKFLLFVVREVRTYGAHETVPDVFLSEEGSHLNLVTCDGVWDKGRQMYTKRLVVFTDAIDGI